MVVEKFQAEIEMLKIRGNRHQTKYTRVDREMNDLLEKQFDKDTVAGLKALWIADYKKEEAESQDRWQAKQGWLGNYEKSFTNDDFVKPIKSRDNRARHSNQHSSTNP